MPRSWRVNVCDSGTDELGRNKNNRFGATPVSCLSMSFTSLMEEYHRTWSVYDDEVEDEEEEDDDDAHGDG
jgi:hypothetical protein